MQIPPSFLSLPHWLVSARDESADSQAAAGGQPPADASAPAPAQPAGGDSAGRAEQARALAAEGGLAPSGPNPPPTRKELDDLAAAVAAADDDGAVRLAANSRAMQLATPQQKAALIRKLMEGHTSAQEEQAIKQIMLSCTSMAEAQQVVQMSGGIQAFADELDGADLQAVIDHGTQLAQKQQAAAEPAIALLEQAQSAEEFEQLYHSLGGEQLKHMLPQPPSAELLARLDALGERYGIAGVGFGMPAEKVSAYMTAIQTAIDQGDDDAIVKLSENSEAMRVASKLQKARMIGVLQEGWTKDSQDMAIARILTSCGSKQEFDQVVDMAGGPGILDDIDYPEAKSDINKLMGGFDRLDCADDKATAEAYRGALMPPAVDALTRSRPPGDRELDDVLGASPYSKEDLRDPAIAEVARQQDEVRRGIGAKAYDLQADPAARNKLALTNRERQSNGQPPLDYTSLVDRACQVANDPSVRAEIEQTIALTEKRDGKLDDEKKQEIREQVLEKRLAALAQQYGLTEQALKTLVTSKMGRLMQEGAQALAATASHGIDALQARLAALEAAPGGQDDPQARALRQSIARIGSATGDWAQRLQETGATVVNLFKVPPSFVEDFVNALSAIGDALAAVVNLVPGVGQAISGAYFGVKAIVGLATGDLLGAFKSLLSAVPGLGAAGVLSTARSVIETAAKTVQAGLSAGEALVRGDLMSLAGAAGSLGAPALLPGDVAKELSAFGSNTGLSTVADLGSNLAPQVGGIVEGVATGDWLALGRAFGFVLPDPLREAAGSAIDDIDQVRRAGGAIGRALNGDPGAAVGPLAGLLGMPGNWQAWMESALDASPQPKARPL